MKKTIVSACVLFAALSTSHAMSIRDYKGYMQNPKTRETVTLMVGAVGQGAMWSNTLLRDQGKKPLYCPPSEQRFGDAEFVSILDKALLSETVDLTPIELVLVSALAKNYPCNK